MPRTIRRRKYKQVSLTQIEIGIFGEREDTADVDSFEIALEDDYGPTIPFALATALACPEGGYPPPRVPAATVAPVSKDHSDFKAITQFLWFLNTLPKWLFAIVLLLAFIGIFTIIMYGFGAGRASVRWGIVLTSIPNKVLDVAAELKTLFDALRFT